MRILVSGSHGLVGKALINSLNPDGHEIVRLVRGKPKNATEIEWHPNEGRLDAATLEGIDAVVHLAGETTPAAVGPTKRNARFAIAASKARRS